MKSIEDLLSDADKGDAYVEEIKDPDKKELYRRLQIRVKVLIRHSNRGDQGEYVFMRQSMKLIFALQELNRYDLCDIVLGSIDAFLKMKGATDEQLNV